MATALVLAIAPALRFVASAGPPATRHEDPPGTPARVLEVYYTPPVLVRAGEQVRIPVDVVCATASGHPCSAEAALGVRESAGSWRLARAPAEPQLQFDVSDPASRAVAASASGSVSFFIQAAGPAGAAVSVPDGGSASPLRLYVVRGMPALRIPAIRFGKVRKPKTVLFLPWGSEPDRAGLDLGHESATIGPPAFDVDARGRVFLLDGLQQRVAVFSRGRLVRQTRISVSPRADIAITPRGAAYVLDQPGSSLRVQWIDPAGRPASSASAGAGILSQIRAVGEQAFVNVLPMDAWVRIDAGGLKNALRIDRDHPTVARPLSGGSGLLRVGSENGVRLGRVLGPAVHDAVELRSTQSLGEVALAEPNGPHGYIMVVHVWRTAPTPADQYQVLRIAYGRVVESFAVGDQRFAETAALSKFRLGRDGHLYQMTEGPDGMRIVRYDLGGES
jgi:hypothetical protein